MLGPITVKEEPDDGNVTDVSAEPGVADAALYDGEEESRDDDVATSTQDDVEAPATPCPPRSVELRHHWRN